MQLPLIKLAPKLTGRQQRALQTITDAGWDGITSYDLGCRLGVHTMWAATSGHDVGVALRRKGLVQQRRRGRSMVWTVAGKLDRPDVDGPGDLPEDF